MKTDLEPCPNCGDEVTDDEYGEYCDAICRNQAEYKERRKKGLADGEKDKRKKRR